MKCHPHDFSCSPARYRRGTRGRFFNHKLKEKLKARNPESTLADMDDIAFLRDLALVKSDSGNIKLTVAGLLFVGKEQAINRLLPQAEVIYLHYSESNLEEYDARLDMKAPIISVIDRLSEKIQDSNRIVNVQVGLFREIDNFQSEKSNLNVDNTI